MKQLVLGALLFVLVPAVKAQQVLQPTDNCRDFSSSDIATFADPNFEEVVRDALSLNRQADLTCGLLGDLTQLAVGSESERVVYGGTLRPSPEKPFENLEGIQNLFNLTNLTILNRLVTDISLISELKNLRFLSLHTNWISDITPLSGLTDLEQLIISENPISDISALSGLTKLTRLHVHGLYPYQEEHYMSMNDGRDTSAVFNGITDVSPLSNLTELRLLRIHLNNITDISPLAGLTKMTHLRLYDNQIKDMSA
ncbi:MAG: leucine-rich repeat domain-containing protein, partial [Pseudomonadota bacterium]|nr:leucine-rich repeat domain-containing protein [Pseudomonadota bacterium]